LLASLPSYSTRSRDMVAAVIAPCQNGLLRTSQTCAQKSGFFSQALGASDGPPFRDRKNEKPRLMPRLKIGLMSFHQYASTTSSIEGIRPTGCGCFPAITALPANRCPGLPEGPARLWSTTNTDGQIDVSNTGRI
jgi:hypothetical protein